MRHTEVVKHEVTTYMHPDRGTISVMRKVQFTPEDNFCLCIAAKSGGSSAIMLTRDELLDMADMLYVIGLEPRLKVQVIEE